jgi:hypothetical protein
VHAQRKRLKKNYLCFLFTLFISVPYKNEKKLGLIYMIDGPRKANTPPLFEGVGEPHVVGGGGGGGGGTAGAVTHSFPLTATQNNKNTKYKPPDLKLIFKRSVQVCAECKNFERNPPNNHGRLLT